MLQEAFDSTQMFSMTLAIDKIVQELDIDSAAQREQVARVVLNVAAETGVFETCGLVKEAKTRLAATGNA